MREGFLLLDRFQALATIWYVEVFEDIDETKALFLQEKIKEMLVSFEATYSRFKKDSLVSELNIKRVVPFDAHLASMLQISKNASELSLGIFDIFIQDKLASKGYGDHYEERDSETLLQEKSSCSISSSSIEIIGSGTIDLGGIGKGYVIDMIRDFLHKENISAFLINGGGDIYVTHNEGKPVELLLQHPIERDTSIGSILLKNQAFCSSSSYVRSWNHNGEQKNHFITPSGEEVWAASFVTGESTTMADIMATVLCVASHDQLLSYEIAERAGVKYLVYDEAFICSGTLEVIT